jgi:multicomponent Na+:H+ antiporter subunit F
MSFTLLAVWILLACLVLYIARVVIGPSIWDRLHGLCLISTKILLIVILFASLNNTAYLLDIAIVYALLGFIGTVFTAMFLHGRLKGDKRE